jgi:hypothetical protein
VLFPELRGLPATESTPCDLTNSLWTPRAVGGHKRPAPSTEKPGGPHHQARRRTTERRCSPPPVGRGIPGGGDRARNRAGRRSGVDPGGLSFGGSVRRLRLAIESGLGGEVTGLHLLEGQRELISVSDLSRPHPARTGPVTPTPPPGSNRLIRRTRVTLALPPAEP